MKKLRVALLAAAHLFMDMTTVAFVFVLTGVREFALPENGAVGLSENAAFAVSACILAYDLIAFGAQPFLGALTDVGRRAAPALYLSLSVAGVAAVLCVLCDFPQGIHAFSVALLVLFALCNAAFHVSAGAFVIPESEKKSAPLGVFVSLGAIGVAAGRLYAPSVLLWAGVGCILFAAAAAALKTRDAVLVPYFERTRLLRAEKEADVFPLLLILFAVFMRGFCGTALAAVYPSAPSLVLLAAFFAAAGKAAGGFVSDRFGVRAAVAVCLPLSACLLFFGGGVPALYLAGTLLFNTSMPVTLWLSFAALPRYRNAAFGLCAAFLMIGSVGAMFVQVPRVAAFALALCGASAVFFAPHFLKNKTVLPVVRIKEVEHDGIS